MKAIEFSPKVHKILQILCKKDPKLYQKIIKQLDLFEKNPRHRSLRLHKVTRQVQNTWSISVDKSFRMLYTEGESFYFFAIGMHDEVYR